LPPRSAASSERGLALSETVNAALRDAARRRTLKGFDVVRDVRQPRKRWPPAAAEEADVDLVHYDRDYSGSPPSAPFARSGSFRTGR
jgi:hypothetical protein